MFKLVEENSLIPKTIDLRLSMFKLWLMQAPTFGGRFVCDSKKILHVQRNPLGVLKYEANILMGDGV